VVADNPYAPPVAEWEPVPAAPQGSWSVPRVYRDTVRTFIRCWPVLLSGELVNHLPNILWSELRRLGPVAWRHQLPWVIGLFAVTRGVGFVLDAGATLQWLTAFRGGKPRFSQIVRGPHPGRFLLLALIQYSTFGLPFVWRLAHPSNALLSSYWATMLVNVVHFIWFEFACAAIVVSNLDVGAAILQGWRIIRGAPLKVLAVAAINYGLHWLNNALFGRVGMPPTAIAGGVATLICFQVLAPAQDAEEAEMSALPALE
jgi:hypothetical protein